MRAFEAKLLCATQMHRAMERAWQWRSRIHGLCHAVAAEPRLPKGWQAALKQIDASPDPDAVVMAVHGLLYPRLIELCEAHARGADADGDRASLELIASFLPALRAERRDGLSLLPWSKRAKART